MPSDRSEPEAGLTAPRAGKQLRALEAVALDDVRQRVDHVLEVAREALEMDIAYFSEFSATHQIIRGAHGDTQSFGFEVGTAAPLDDGYCRRMVAGELANVVPDTHSDPVVRDLPATASSDLGAYVGVPVQLGDGRVYGTLCCASHAPHALLDDRDARFMRVLARLLADELDRQAAASPPAAQATEAVDDVVARLMLWFAAAPRAAPAARQALASLDDHLGEEHRYTLNLLVTELVTNSVRHAEVGPASAVGLEVSVGRHAVRVEVTDPGPGFDPAAIAQPEIWDEGGRGLLLVERLAARWGVEHRPGTCVWFELSLD